MNNVANILEIFTKEFNERYIKKEIVYENSLVGEIKFIKDKLLDEIFLPSSELEQILNKQLRRAMYPMEVAITGQFSAGKSTFLNALLSKDILPTGITPVTSKVNFINYGEEYKLKITYHSGAQEYHSIDSISNFTDQREKTIDDIKYLTIYAPMDILKDITFVDTPGLNSQSANDTQTTRNVLRNVGGIIWLTLIDNAGKMSEMEILDEYMPYFKTKSLCVLNQKDKFTKEQINTTTSYIKEKFSKYFTQVTPISAKMALDARVLEKNILIENSLENILNEFKDNLKNNIDANSLDFFENNFNQFQKQVSKIKSLDIQKNMELLEESNIQDVLDFINNVMRPNAVQSKEYAIKKDLKSICDILINQYIRIIAVYDSLLKILNNKDEIIKIFDNINKKYYNELYSIYNNIDMILETISNEIFQSITTKKDYRFEISLNILKQEKIQKFEFDTYIINEDLVFKNLYYDDQIVEKKFKRVIKQFKNIELITKDDFENIYENIQNDIISWKEQYQQLKKARMISSDLEYAKVRRFASQIYENILKSFHIALLGNVSALNKKSAYFNALLTNNHQQIIDATVAHFQRQIQESLELYKKEPSKFAISKPSQDEIIKKLKEKFSFYKLEEFLISKKNYLAKIIKYAKNEYEEINEEKINFILDEQVQYKQKIEVLTKIQDSI